MIPDNVCGQDFLFCHPWLVLKKVNHNTGLNCLDFWGVGFVQVIPITILKEIIWCAIRELQFILWYLVLPSGRKSLLKRTERMKVNPLLVKNIIVAENLPKPTLSALVSCRFDGRPSSKFEMLVLFVYSKLICKIFIWFVTGGNSEHTFHWSWGEYLYCFDVCHCACKTYSPSYKMQWIGKSLSIKHILIP